MREIGAFEAKTHLSGAAARRCRGRRGGDDHAAGQGGSATGPGARDASGPRRLAGPGGGAARARRSRYAARGDTECPRRRPPVTLVIDATALAALLLPGAEGAGVADRLRRSGALIAPSLLWAEIRNILIVAERRGRFRLRQWPRRWRSPMASPSRSTSRHRPRRCWHWRGSTFWRRTRSTWNLRCAAGPRS